MTQKSKGKQKQASEADLNEDETSKPKPRAKKAAPAKKNKAPRQTSKKAVIAAGDISKEKVGPPKARQNKPKGRRKKAGTYGSATNIVPFLTFILPRHCSRGCRGTASSKGQENSNSKEQIHSKGGYR
jgi:hypothetical protein